MPQFVDPIFFDLQRQSEFKRKQSKGVSGDYFRFMMKVLSDLGIAEADSMTPETVEAIPDEEVNALLEQTYGQNGKLTLSSFEKKLIYLALKQGVVLPA